MKIRALLAAIVLDESAAYLARHMCKVSIVEEIDKTMVKLYELQIQLEMELNKEIPENVISILKKKKY